MPVNRNLVQRMRQALYILKRQYGARIDIYSLLDSDTDVRTGEKTISKTMFPVERAIVLPVTIDRSVQQGISAISANKEFVMGGSYDVGTRKVIIDRRDCPTLSALTADDWIVYDGDKYQIKSVEEFEIDCGWILTVRKLLGEVPEQIILVQADHLLDIESTASAVVE